MWRPVLLVVIACQAFGTATGAQTPAAHKSREDWIRLKDSRFVLPEGVKAYDILVEIDPLVASTDPVLRDDVAYTAAERWILRERKLTPDEVRKLRDLWLSNLQDGLGTAGDDRVFKRSFSALSLSLVAALDVAAPFMDQAEFDRFFDRTLDYFEREVDLRGFDVSRGWMHTPAHTADVLKFLGRNSKLPEANCARVLKAVDSKLRASASVFTWGEGDRIAAALVPYVRRGNVAETQAWIAAWVPEHARLWASGPQVDPGQFALVENGKQVLRSLFVALSMDAATPAGDTAKAAILAALQKMR